LAVADEKIMRKKKIDRKRTGWKKKERGTKRLKTRAKSDSYENE
jgi:hypothetical protein